MISSPSFRTRTQKGQRRLACSLSTKLPTFLWPLKVSPFLHSRFQSPKPAVFTSPPAPPHRRTSRTMTSPYGYASGSTPFSSSTFPQIPTISCLDSTVFQVVCLLPSLSSSPQPTLHLSDLSEVQLPSHPSKRPLGPAWPPEPPLTHQRPRSCLRSLHGCSPSSVLPRDSSTTPTTRLTHVKGQPGPPSHGSLSSVLSASPGSWC